MSGWSYECPCRWKIWKLPEDEIKQICTYISGHHERHLLAVGATRSLGTSND